MGGGGERSGWDLLPPALLSVWGAFACWASGGLETQLFTFLLLLGITAAYLLASELVKGWFFRRFA